MLKNFAIYKNIIYINILNINNYNYMKLLKFKQEIDQS